MWHDEDQANESNKCRPCITEKRGVGPSVATPTFFTGKRAVRHGLQDEVLADGLAKVEEMEQVGCVRDNEWQRRAADLLAYEVRNLSSKNLARLAQWNPQQPLHSTWHRV